MCSKAICIEMCHVQYDTYDIIHNKAKEKRECHPQVLSIIPLKTIQNKSPDFAEVLDATGYIFYMCVLLFRLIMTRLGAKRCFGCINSHVAHMGKLKSLHQ